VQLRAGRSLVDLVPVDGALGRAGGAAARPEGRNLDHFCFRVEPFDEASIRRDLSAAGVAAGETVMRSVPRAKARRSTSATRKATPSS
jgi:hypothetical protein